MVTRFKFIGGALCLDFVNTAGDWTGPARLRDKFCAPADMKRWAAMAGMAHQRVTPAVFRRAIALRDALYRVFVSIIHRRTPPARDLELLNREIGRMRSGEKIAYIGRAIRIEREEIPIITPVLASALDLLTSDDLNRLRRCGGDRCGWLFLDTSRNRSRQWCEMRVCGNRIKARRFREQRKRETSGS